MEPAIDIERFASLSAEIDAGTSREEVCAREGLSVEEWTHAQEAWLSRFADETARKRFALTNRYNAVFVERRRAITHGGRAATKRARPAHAASTSTPAASPPIAPPPVQMPSYAVRSELGGEAASPIAAPPIVPSYAIAEAPVPPTHAYVAPAPIAPEPSATETAPIPFVAVTPTQPRKGATMAMPAFDEPGGAPLPFTPVRAGVPPAPPPPVSMGETPKPPAPPNPAPRDIDIGEGTGTVNGTSPIARAKPVTPFEAVAIGEKPKPPVSPSRLGDATVSDAISPFAQGAAALPFQAGASASKPVAPPPVAPPLPLKAPVATPVKVDATPAPDATVYGAISPFAKGAPLPFQPSKPAEPRPAGQQSGGALPFQSKPPPSGAVRPSPSMVAGGNRLTIEQFASLTAEIAVNPRGAAQIRARYGLDEAAHAAEAEKYNRRFGAEKALYDRYVELFQSYRDYVARAQR